MVRVCGPPTAGGVASAAGVPSVSIPVGQGGKLAKSMKEVNHREANSERELNDRLPIRIIDKLAAMRTDKGR